MTSRRPARRRPTRRPARRRGPWPTRARVVLFVLLVGGLGYGGWWFWQRATWIKVATGVGVVVLLVAYWLWTRRHEIRAEMDGDR